MKRCRSQIRLDEHSAREESGIEPFETLRNVSMVIAGLLSRISD